MAGSQSNVGLGKVQKRRDVVSPAAIMAEELRKSGYDAQKALCILRGLGFDLSRNAVSRLFTA